MTVPTMLSGHDRTYLPPRALRGKLGTDITAWDLLGLEADPDASGWATCTLDALISSIDQEAADLLGCTDCPDTGFYGIADLNDPDMLVDLVRRVDNGAHERLTATGAWEPQVDSATLEVLDLDIAGDLAAAITAGACGLLRRYGTPRAWLPPAGVIAAAPLSLFLSADGEATPQGEWVNLAVVDEVDQGAVFDLVRVTASALQRWDGGDWIPDEDLLVKADLPMVRLDEAQLAEIQSQLDSVIVASTKPTDPQKCHYCETATTKSVIHSEGVAYVPACPEHLDKANADAAACVPSGKPDPSNIDGIRDITATAAIVADAPLTVSPDPRAEKLRRYWSTGKGAAKIRWNTPGDAKRCHRHLEKYMPGRAWAYCNNLHKRNTHVWTGDRRNVGGNGRRGRLLSSALGQSPEETLLASLRSRPSIGTTEGNTTMPDLHLLDGEYAAADYENADLITALTAGAIPVAPPDEWFDDPKLDRPTTITIEASGRVYGHLAPWDITHIGMAGEVPPPPNADKKYRFFRTGQLVTASGGNVRVGQLTLAGGHAPTRGRRLTTAEVVKHYDDTATGVADVAAGEDEHGIWVAGALRPSVTPEQVRVMRACPPSGDWREINGNLELVAACHVNVQGFPIAASGVAGGATVALVAAGARTMAELMAMERSDAVVLARVAELQATVDSLVASAAVAEAPVDAPAVVPDDPAEANPAAAATQEVEDPSSNATSNEAPEEEEVVEPTEEELARADKIAKARDLVSSIRKDVLRNRKLQATTAAASTVKGTDSFPISDVASLKKAIKANGRAKDKEAARKHIISMAYKLKRPDLIPSEWRKKD